ncbi:MAG: hypothetical protein M1817_003179 [Caeruleum heppii]|nr:MAG: hypothetical protein M1817_003179 [Caeruleum heppii]
MTEEPRRSGRATKGQHTKILDPPVGPVAASKTKLAKSSKEASKDGTPEDEEDDQIRCICGITSEDEEDEARPWISCDQCDCWQHNDCMGMPDDDKDLPDKYFCEQCRPENHKELLEKLGRGERPWEELAKKREEDKQKKGRKRKGGRRAKGAKKGEAADATPEVEENGTTGDAIVDGASHDIPQAGDDKATPEMAPPTERRESGVKRKGRAEEEEATPETGPQAKVRKVGSTATTNKEEKPSAAPRKTSKDTSIQSELVSSVSELRNNVRKSTASLLVKNLGAPVAQAEKDDAFQVPDGKDLLTVTLELALEIEHAVYMKHSRQPGDPSPNYRQRMRSTIFNLKNNAALLRRLLRKTLAPEELAVMTTDEMASDELQQRTAEMKKEAEKQHIIIKEEGPRIRRTHKGEEIVGDERENGGGNESIFTTAPARRRSSMMDTEMANSPTGNSVSPQSPQMSETHDIADNHHGRTMGSPPPQVPLKVKTSGSPQIGGPERKSSSSAFNIQDVWSSVHSPDAEKQRAGRPPPLPTTQRTDRPMASPYGQSGSPTIDTEIDQLLNDDVESPPYSPTDHAEDPTNIWNGKLAMPGVAEFSATGKHVAGADLSANIAWTELIPSYLSIDGRISVDRASDYLCGLRWSKTTDVVVVSLSPAGGSGNQRHFDKLWTYFDDRTKYGVVGKLPLATIKDAYIIPLEAGLAKLPPFMEILEHMTLEAERPDRALLLTFVVKVNGDRSSAQGTPSQSLSAMSPGTQTTGPGVGYGMSPTLPSHTHPITTTATPTPQPPPSTQPPQPPSLDPSSSSNIAASHILGPELISAPVVQQLLHSSGGNIDESQLAVVREILERVPRARADLGLLGVLLEEKGRGE